MKTLDEHNELTLKGYSLPPGKSNDGANVLCDDCGNEMIYTDANNLILMSNPPQRNVHCPKCNKKGYKVK